jgi:hypothetical protein
MISLIGHSKSFREPCLSNTLIAQGHPCLVVEEIANRHGADLIFTYSRYEVAPPGLQAVAPRSAVLRVPARDVTPDWIAHRFEELGPNEEMAWHSWVKCEDVGFHIPMIDFVDRPDRSVLCQLGPLLEAEMGLRGSLALFDTGRSFHGYFPDLIPERGWPKYLGQLLLLNEHDRPPVIDTRWIGHALVRGFTALRWSHNTDRYRAMPRLSAVFDVGNPEATASGETKSSPSTSASPI